jgi:ABC-type transport system involved in multi-copper enzyme maturation permease subunit
MSASALRPLLGHHWRRHRLPLLPMAGAAALFEFLITRVAPGLDELAWAKRMLQVIPPQMLALAGSDISGSPGSFLAIGYGHPFFLLLLAAWIVRVSSNALAGEIGSGTMDLLASRPVRRWHQVAAAGIAIAAGLTLIVGAAWAGTAIGIALRPLGVTAAPFLPIAAGGWLLFAAWGAVGLLVSALRRDSGSAIAWTSGLMALSFVLEYLARLWKTIAALRPFSLFAYYAPQQTLASGLPIADAVLLATVAGTAAALAVLVFGRRDL